MPHSAWEARRAADDRFYGSLAFLAVIIAISGLIAFTHARDARVAGLNVAAEDVQ